MVDSANFTLERVIELSGLNGFFPQSNVGHQKLTVLTIDHYAPLIRFFYPEIVAKPWGRQLGGSFGLAISEEAGKYELSVSHHVLNYKDIVSTGRTISSSSDVGKLLGLIRTHLESFPATWGDVANWSHDSGSWLGKRVAWERPDALRFVSAAERMSRRAQR